MFTHRVKMKITNWKEFLAAGGVMISLLFVGIEISQNTSATRGQTRTELAALNQDWLFLVSNDKEGVLFHTMFISDERDQLSPIEVSRATLLMIANLRRLENVYYQYEEGLVDSTALESYGFRTNTGLFDGAAFSEFWYDLDNREIFHPGFVALFESRTEIRRN